MPLDNTTFGAIESDPRVDTMVRRWDELKVERSHHEQDWEDIARAMRPQRGGFSNSDPAQHRNNKTLSSAAMIARSNFSSTLYSTMVNPANKWMSLAAADPDLAGYHAMKIWQDMASAKVLASFRPSVSPFYTATTQLFADVASFANGAQYDEVRPNEGKILDITISLSEIVYDIDAFGRNIEVVRRFSLTARAASDMFGHENLPEKLRDKAEKGSVDKFVFYHHVHKNVDWQHGKLGPRGKRWLSTYGVEEGRAVLRESGYGEMPFYGPRWEVDTGQTYGHGPGHVALPSSRVLERMKEANLKGGQFAADPVLLGPDKDAWPLSGQIRPGEMVYGGVNYQGQKVVQPLHTYQGTGLSLEMQQMEISDIQEAFHWNLMNLANRTGVTSLESMERQEQNARLMAPYMGRLQEEYLAVKIGRRFQMLWRAGQIPPPPPEAEGQPLEVKYLSAAALAQKSSEGAAVIRIFNDLAPLVGVKPRFMDRIDDDNAIDILVEARGAPERLLKSRDEADEIAQAREQQAQAAQAMQAAQAGGGIMKDMAQAQAMGGGV